MASSSSYTYDVFLSFRGPDTRKSFTGHLYAALIRGGINTFLDDKELETGKRISAELPTAIEHSSISIVVLSKNYAHSRWCLDEILKIVECMDIRKQLVMPVFYDVEPWEVRRQGGSFAEAFACHSSCVETQKLETWKSALTRVADLKGWDVPKIANGCEATVISQVVEKVYRVLKNKTCLTGPINLVGMSSRIAKIKSRWDARSTTGPYFIGLYGMGGVGKTTTANAFYDLIRTESFEGRYVLENIGEHSRKVSGGLLQLQERLLSGILDIEHLRLDSLSMGTAWMSQKLSSRKVLIIFDDIDKLDQLRALVGERSWFGTGSTVIITTRDKGLLQIIPVDVEYAVELLDVLQSKELFSRHAFEGSPVPEPHKKLLHDIVHYCGGLPLALQILGSHLFNKPLQEWKHTLDKNQGTESVQCINGNYHEEITFSTETFQKMHYLRLLRLENVNLKGSFQHIFTDLKFLFWQKCPLNWLPSTFGPQNLVVLDLRDSKNLITVWEDILGTMATAPGPSPAFMHK